MPLSTSTVAAEVLELANSSPSTLKSLFEECLVPEDQLLTTAKISLRNKYNKLMSIRNACKIQLNSNSIENIDMLRSLTSKIKSEMELYEYFLRSEEIERQDTEADYTTKILQSEEVETQDTEVDSATKISQSDEMEYPRGLQGLSKLGIILKQRPKKRNNSTITARQPAISQIREYPSIKPQSLQKIALATLIETKGINDTIKHLATQYGHSNIYGRSIFALFQCLCEQMGETAAVLTSLRRDQSEVFTDYRNLRSKSFTPYYRECQLCLRLINNNNPHLSQESGALRVFDCRHAFHESCLKKQIEDSQLYGSYSADLWLFELIRCILCNSPNPSLAKGKSKLLDNPGGLVPSSKSITERFRGVEAYLKTQNCVIQIAEGLSKETNAVFAENSIDYHEEE